MLVWLRQKYADRKAKRAELRVAQQNADADLKANPLLVTRATRVLNRRMLRRWSLCAAFSVAVTGVTTAYPDLVSTPLDTHAAANGVGDGLQKHFATPNIRVYQRHNPLMPFHLAGQMVRLSWSRTDTALGGVFVAPFYYATGMLQGIFGVIAPSALDAYSLSDNRPHAERQCYIRPPGEVDSESLIKSFTGIAGNHQLHVSNAADIKRYYYTRIMAHEARHCDQDKDMQASALNEIDADVTADRLTAGTVSDNDRVVLQGVWETWRIISAVMGNNTGHYTTTALIRGSVTPMQAIDDAAVVERLVRVLQDAAVKNKDAFPSSMRPIEQRYHLTLSLLAQEDAGDAQLRAKAELFVRAVNHIDGIAQNQLIVMPHAQIAGRIDVSWLTREYQPVPVPVSVKPAVLRVMSPRAGS